MQVFFLQRMSTDINPNFCFCSCFATKKAKTKKWDHATVDLNIPQGFFFRLGQILVGCIMDFGTQTGQCNFVWCQFAEMGTIGLSWPKEQVEKDVKGHDLHIGNSRFRIENVH